MILALLAALLTTTSASAVAGATSAKKPAPQEIIFDLVVTDASYDPATGVIGDDAVVTGTTKGSGFVALSSGTGPGPSASGCRATTLTNTARSAVFQTVLFRYITVTSYCWNQAAKSVSNIGLSWRIEDVASTMYWRGEVNRDLGFYSWTSGYPTSGYHHIRQGSFENCVLKYGCIGIWYPSNDFRVHSDGTYADTLRGADK
jgi:hypothetical protein